LPDYFNSLLNFGITGSALRGERGGEVSLETVQLRNYTPKDYKGVDDSPYGGGAGMVMRADVLKRALLEGVVEAGGYGEDFKSKLHVVFPGPRGKLGTIHIAKSLLGVFRKGRQKILFLSAVDMKG
jgi:tRNA (guanine37-N1)-methyltransferase